MQGVCHAISGSKIDCGARHFRVLVDRNGLPRLAECPIGPCGLHDPCQWRPDFRSAGPMAVEGVESTTSRGMAGSENRQTAQEVCWRTYCCQGERTTVPSIAV